MHMGAERHLHQVELAVVAVEDHGVLLVLQVEMEQLTLVAVEVVVQTELLLVTAVEV